VSPDLLTLFGIDESDIAANRAGRMGTHQQATLRANARRLRLTGVGGGAVFALLTAVVVAQGGGSWPVILVVGVGWVVLCLLLAGMPARGSTAAVQCLSGSVRVRKVKTAGTDGGLAHTSLWLDVAGSSCLLPSAVSFDLDRWRAALGPGSLRVYVYGGPKIPKVVGIEQAPD
jgi:hypothetical protein